MDRQQDQKRRTAGTMHHVPHFENLAGAVEETNFRCQPGLAAHQCDHLFQIGVTACKQSAQCAQTLATRKGLAPQRGHAEGPGQIQHEHTPKSPTQRHLERFRSPDRRDQRLPDLFGDQTLAAQILTRLHAR